MQALAPPRGVHAPPQGPDSVRAFSPSQQNAPAPHHQEDCSISLHCNCKVLQDRGPIRSSSLHHNSVDLLPDHQDMALHIGITKEVRVQCAALRLLASKHSNTVSLPHTRTISMWCPGKDHSLELRHSSRSMSRQARLWEYTVCTGRARYKDHMHLLWVFHDQVVALSRWEGSTTFNARHSARSGR